MASLTAILYVLAVGGLSPTYGAPSSSRDPTEVAPSRKRMIIRRLVALTLALLVPATASADWLEDCGLNESDQLVGVAVLREKEGWAPKISNYMPDGVHAYDMEPDRTWNTPPFWPGPEDWTYSHAYGTYSALQAGFSGLLSLSWTEDEPRSLKETHCEFNARDETGWVMRGYVFVLKPEDIGVRARSLISQWDPNTNGLTSFRQAFRLTELTWTKRGGPLGAQGPATESSGTMNDVPATAGDEDHYLSVATSPPPGFRFDPGKPGHFGIGWHTESHHDAGTMAVDECRRQGGGNCSFNASSTSLRGGCVGLAMATWRDRDKDAERTYVVTNSSFRDVIAKDLRSACEADIFSGKYEDTVVEHSCEIVRIACAGDTIPATVGAAPLRERESARPRPIPGSTFRDRLLSGGEGLEMVVIPAGSFRMGCLSDDGDCWGANKPVHEVRIPAAFALSVHEVTFDDYDRFTYPNKVDDEGWGRGSRPAINVSWDDAKEYVAWLSSETGADYRLPSEAEWEYAARAGTVTKYSWGNEIGSNRANCDNERCGDQWTFTGPVGSFRRNGFGLYDINGNVWEWVEDCWNSSYSGAPSDGSPWLRGDSWSSSPRPLRAAYRGGSSSGFRSSSLGFRVARTLTP